MKTKEEKPENSTPKPKEMIQNSNFELEKEVIKEVNNIFIMPEEKSTQETIKTTKISKVQKDDIPLNEKNDIVRQVKNIDDIKENNKNIHHNNKIDLNYSFNEKYHKNDDLSKKILFLSNQKNH